MWARSSAGEHYVDIVGVVGSIPTAPTTKDDRYQALGQQVSYKADLCLGIEIDSMDADQLRRALHSTIADFRACETSGRIIRKAAPPLAELLAEPEDRDANGS